jgi:hypothetical protein
MGLLQIREVEALDDFRLRLARSDGDHALLRPRDGVTTARAWTFDALARVAPLD